MKVNEKESLWVERYRPSTLDDCILPADTKKMFAQFIENGEVPNMLLTGSPGVGKTTAARALANDIGADIMFINGSDESGIDTLRTKIRNFASTVSMTQRGKKKIVIIDEADYLNPNSFQPALRAFMEEFSNTCRFILTCNYKNRIIEPLRDSRLVNVDYTINKSDKSRLMAEFMKRLMFILQAEGFTCKPVILADLIKKMNPDYRKMINFLQKLSAQSVDGVIEFGTSFDSEDALGDLIDYLSEKKFTEMRKWIGENSDMIDTSFYSVVYHALLNKLQDASIPQAIIIFADYQKDASFVADQELHAAACLTTIMGDCMFK